MVLALSVSVRLIYPISIDQNGHFGHSGQSQNGPKWFPISKNLRSDTKIKSLGLSKQNLQFWDFLVPWTYFWLSEMAKKRQFWPLRLIWGAWQWFQWISHGPKPGDRHQNQVSSTFQTKVTNLVIFGYISFSVPNWNRRRGLLIYIFVHFLDGILNKIL